jgi:small subunit ribosomal protein S6
MREYEIVYIFRSTFTPEEIEARIERYHALLTGDGKGEITAVEQWGKRQLAYPIQKQPNGYYVVAQFTADPAALPEFERVLTLEEDVLRYLIVLSEGELPVAGSMQAAMDDRVTPPTAAPAGAVAPNTDEATTDAPETAEASEASTDESATEEAADSASDDDGADEESASEGDDGDEAGEEAPSADGDETGEEDAAAEGEAGPEDDGGDDAEDDDAADDAAEKEE